MSPPDGAVRRFLRRPLALLPAKLFLVIAAYVLVGRLIGRLRWTGISFPIAATVLLCIVLCGAFALYTRLVERRALTEFAARGALAESLRGLLLGLLVFSAMIGVLAAIDVYRVDGVGDASSLVGSFCNALLAGVFEELVFRAVLFRILETWLGSYWALCISSVLFGAAHLLNPNSDPLAAAKIALEAGLLLGAAYMFTRRLWFAIGIHVGWDFAEGGIFGTVESGTSVNGLLHSTLHGPAWLSGGGFGVEASPIAVLIGLGAGLLLLTRARMRHEVRAPSWVRPQPSGTAVTP